MSYRGHGIARWRGAAGAPCGPRRARAGHVARPPVTCVLAQPRRAHGQRQRLAAQGQGHAGSAGAAVGAAGWCGQALCSLRMRRCAWHCVRRRGDSRRETAHGQERRRRRCRRARGRHSRRWRWRWARPVTLLVCRRRRCAPRRAGAHCLLATVVRPVRAEDLVAAYYYTTTRRASTGGADSAVAPSPPAFGVTTA